MKGTGQGSALAVGVLLWSGPCLADLGSCSGGADGVAFGSLTLSSLQNATATGDQIVVCPGGITPTQTWDFCGSIGVGSNSVSQTDRRMTSGSSYISYQLYTDAARTIPYQYTGSNLVTATYNASSGVAKALYVYGKILSSGVSLPPGVYTDSYSVGAQAVIVNDAFPTGSVSYECTGASSTHWWNTTAFSVSVTLLASCTVSAAPLNFGAVGVLSANTDATTNLSVACTYTTPYSIALSAGLAPGATTSSRAMTQGSAKVSYALYRDAGRSLNWGSNVGVDTLAGVGTGATQSVPVYGRVPPQTTPPIGTYADTVVVTVNY